MNSFSPHCILLLLLKRPVLLSCEKLQEVNQARRVAAPAPGRALSWSAPAVLLQVSAFSSTWFKTTRRQQRKSCVEREGNLLEMRPRSSLLFMSLRPRVRWGKLIVDKTTPLAYSAQGKTFLRDDRKSRPANPIVLVTFPTVLDRSSLSPRGCVNQMLWPDAGIRQPRPLDRNVLWGL